MAYVQIPRDLNKIKEKFLFGLPKRQVLYFGVGIVVGIVPFFILLNYDITAAVVVLMVCIMPFGFFGMYEKNGLTCDKLFRNWFRANILRPKIRTYKTENLYVALSEQYFIDKEAKRIGYKKGIKDKLGEAIQKAGKKKKRK